MKPFDCITLSPIELAANAIPLATLQAGGIALLDAEFCPAGAVAAAVETLQRLLTALPGAQMPAAESRPARIGVRLAAGQLAALAPLLRVLAGQPHHVVLAGWTAAALPALLAELALPGRHLWLEAGAVADTALAPLVGTAGDGAFAGWVARGSECGGRCGSASAFILCQHLARQPRPFWVQGAIGLHTAAACRAAGAAGVILDDSLLLLRESPLTPHQRALLAQVSGEDTKLVEGVDGVRCRIVNRPTFAAAHRLAHGRAESADAAVIGWGDPDRWAWPLGQGAGHAADLAAQFGTVGKTIQAVVKASAGHWQTAAAVEPLAPDSSLARRHGTTYPIVQGPMTRVSDRSEFAAAVAAAGALPLLALARLRQPEVARLLRETQALLGDRPWGVGLLGFLPPELRDEQMAAIAAARPPFALIAGGRPDQAAPLEAQGIATYLHAPTPALLRLFLRQGGRRFVFEGAECGGHVGPLAGFALWEGVVDLLLHEAPAADLAQLQLLFAGGIHDATSAAMIAALAAPLAQRGAAVGVLMGTAYLFTEEAVACGAIVSAMQEEAIHCTATVTLETGPGHLIRGAQTPFAADFAATRAQLRAAGRTEGEITEALESLLLGRLRIATKGLIRADSELQAVAPARQRAEGMYMMGEAATLRSAPTTCADLHRAVSVGSAELLAKIAGESVAAAGAVGSAPPARPAEVAIVGVGCLLPGAQDPETLWRNLLDQVNTIREIPGARWDWRLLYDPDKAAPDKIYSRWGGFIDALPFDPLRYGIPPNSLPSISLPQLLALETTRLALRDAGYGDGIEDEGLRRRTAVFFAASNTADMEELYMARSALPLVSPDIEAMRRLPVWTEESYPGILVNVIAGRVANRFDLGGPNLTVDAACASSLAALDLAVRELESGRSDLVLTGGIEFEQTPQAYMAFSKTQALSPQGRARVFDQAGDGIVISEGAIVLVLKRLADAERDGDHIYALIQAVAGSSDGKGFGLTAPKPAGQRSAFERAHALAGSDPAGMQLYEAHATGTAVGDRSELEMIGGALAAAGALPHSCAIGSAKSLLGHTRATAGMVGVIKAAMALSHGVLPPHAGVENPLAPLAAPECPVYLLDQARPWLAGSTAGAQADAGVSAGAAPRRAGVSAFGFGGANFHAVLEEYSSPACPTAPGAACWPWELIVLTAASRDELQRRLARLVSAAERLEAGPLAAGPLAAAPAAALHLRDLAYTCAVEARSGDLLRLALVVSDAADLRQKAASSLAHWQTGVDLPPGVFVSAAARGAHQQAAEISNDEPGDVAFLFPGQGSQYPGMGAELALYFGEMRRALAQADACCPGLPQPLSRLLLPPAAFNEAERQAQVSQLAATAVAQPAIAAVSAGLLDLAARLGLTPARVAGHSFGEFVALHAAGAIDRSSLLRLAAARGRIMADLGPAGSMAVALLSRPALAPYLAAHPGVTLANNNAPEQCALSGSIEALEQISRQLQADGHTVRPLSVSAAFHSPLMQPARRPFADFLAAQIAIQPPVLPVHANLDGAPYPAEPDQIRTRWVGHLENCVDFVGQVEQMYAAGVRTFVEIGPGRVLTGLLRRILQGRSHRALAVDSGSPQGGLKSWLAALAELFTAGVSFNLEALFQERPVRWVDLDQMPPPPAALRWMIDGGRVWATDAAARSGNELPLLTSETAAAARAAFHSRSPERAAAALAGWESAASEGAAGGLPASSAGAAWTASDTTLSAVYREYQETMRQFLAQQERLMNQVLARAEIDAGQAHNGAVATTREQDGGPHRVPELAPPPSAAPVPVKQAPSTAPPARADAARVPLDRAALMQRLVAMVSERTGYPPDLLKPDQDLEAELGVDSIKRIEILGRLPSLLPAEVAARVQGKLDRLAGLKSLNALVDVLMPEIEAVSSLELDRVEPAPLITPSPAPAPAAAPAQPGAGDANPGCPRYLMQGVEAAPAPDHAGRIDGLILVTEDALGASRIVCELLAQRGAHVFLIPRRELLDLERLEKRVMSLLYLHGSLAGIVHMAALGLAAECETLDAWHTATTLTTKSFFRLLQLCALGFADAVEPVRILAVSQFDGAWGRTGPIQGAPAAGSAHGMLRTLESEFPKVFTKVVDFDAMQPPVAMARSVVDELLASDGCYEIGYPAGRRTQFLARPAPLPVGEPANDWQPQAGWVVLVTGGARGITAEICRQLARPGVHLIIVGRSPAPAASDAPPDTDLAAIREQLIAAMRAQGIERTPAEIESEARELQREHERRRNLSELAAAGAAVEYHAVDVRSEAAFGGLIDDLYARFGRLDAVVHGAGIIEDRQMEEKSPASFARVFDTKVDSAYLLSRHLCPAGLRWVVFFASVAGRFGNQGQVDYAGANEVLNRLACQLDLQWPDTRVVSINWGPWQGTGMANQGIQRQFITKGIASIEPADGVRFFVDELAYGRKGEVEIIAGEGPWKVDAKLELSTMLELSALFTRIRNQA